MIFLLILFVVWEIFGLIAYFKYNDGKDRLVLLKACAMLGPIAFIVANWGRN